MEIWIKKQNILGNFLWVFISILYEDKMFQDFWKRKTVPGIFENLNIQIVQQKNELWISLLWSTLSYVVIYSRVFLLIYFREENTANIVKLKGWEGRITRDLKGLQSLQAGLCLHRRNLEEDEVTFISFFFQSCRREKVKLAWTST